MVRTLAALEHELRRAAPQPHDAAHPPHRRGRAVPRPLPRDPGRRARRRRVARGAARRAAGPARGHRAGAVRPPLRGAGGQRVPRAVSRGQASTLLLLDRTVEPRRGGHRRRRAHRHARRTRRWSRVRVGELRRVVCASPAYLRRRGVPHTPDDIRDARLRALLGGLTPASEWRFRVGRKARRRTARSRLASNQVDAAVAACEDGLGLGMFLSYQVAADVRGAQAALRARGLRARSGAGQRDLSAGAPAVGQRARVRRPRGGHAARDALRVIGTAARPR